jgi:hypothetical protein
VRGKATSRGRVEDHRETDRGTTRPSSGRSIPISYVCGVSHVNTSEF